MKRIAVVVTTPMYRQGITSVVLNLLKKMNREQLSIAVLTALPVEGWFCKELENLGISFVSIQVNRIKQLPDYVRKLSKYVEDHKIDVLHVHGNSATMWIEIFAAKKAGVPVRIAHSHNSSCLSKALHYLLRPLLIRDMTLGIGCSDLSRKFAFDNKKSIVLNNGIDTEKFQFNAQVRGDYRLQFELNNAFVIGHVGNLLPVKNHLFLCRVAEELKRRGCADIRLFLAGEGQLRGNIEAFVKEKELSNMVTLLGSRPDVDKLYQMFDLLVLPSHYEGFPMVLVEAQTAGLPCLISDKVTKTTDLIGKAQYLTIDGENAVSVWADAIVAAVACSVDDRVAGKATVDLAGYSVVQSSRILQKIYQDGTTG